MNPRRLCAAAMVVLAAAALSACGRNGRPVVPDYNVYPRTYPFSPFPVARPEPSAAAPTGTEDRAVVSSPDKANTSR